MGKTRAPTWYAATGLHKESSRVYEAFQDFLHNLPISYTDLAASVGVSQPAVSRWAGDVTHPSLEEMTTAVEVVQARLEKCRMQTVRFSEILGLIVEAMRLYDLEVEGRADVDPHQRRVTMRLREELGLAPENPGRSAAPHLTGADTAPTENKDPRRGVSRVL